MNFIRQTWMKAVVAVASIVLGGCVTGGPTSSGPAPATGASASTHQAADRGLYQSVSYANAAQKGPAIIVLPGEVRSTNATFTQRYRPNNIAEYAELELSQANFQVLERENLSSVLREIELAYNMGDPAKAQALFNRGELQNTRWIIKFDIPRAEKVAEAGSSFNTDKLSRLAGSLLSGKAAQVLLQGDGAVETTREAGVWIVGMRYKIIDARTTQQVAQGYAEDKMEVGSVGTSVFGLTSQQAGGTTLDSLVVKLVQKSVMDIDQKYK